MFICPADKSKHVDQFQSIFLRIFLVVRNKKCGGKTYEIGRYLRRNNPFRSNKIDGVSPVRDGDGGALHRNGKITEIGVECGVIEVYF